MQRTRATLAVALALVSACSGGSKKVKGPAAPAEPATFTVSVESLAGVLPADVSFVMGASAVRLRESPLWNPLASALLSKGQAELDEVKALCNLDLLADTDTVLVAGRGMAQREADVLIIIKGKWDRDKLNDCFVKLVEKKDGKKAEVRQDGRFWTYGAPGDDTIYTTWLARDTVAVCGKPDDRAALASFFDAPGKLTGQPLAGLLGNVTAGSMLWGAMLVPPEESGQLMSSLGAAPSAFYGQVDFPAGLDAKVGIRFADDATARTFTDRASKELDGARQNPFLGPYLAGLKIVPAGADAVVTLAMEREQVEQLMSLLMAQLGGMMGGAE